MRAHFLKIKFVITVFKAHILFIWKKKETVMRICCVKPPKAVRKILRLIFRNRIRKEKTKAAESKQPL